jgi:hypothetical protein
MTHRQKDTGRWVFCFSGHKREELKVMSITGAHEWDLEFSQSERELLKELAVAIREIRYGSVVLTIHDGRLVEVSKTERIRRNVTERI